MWQCEVCGRTVEGSREDHECDGKPVTIDAYIAAQSEDIQMHLRQIRDTIHFAIPDVEERISWGMPTYWKQHNIIHFAAHKNHVGLYPGNQAIEHFRERLSAYKTSKGAVQFQYVQSIPLDLIADIARWCRDTGNHH